MFSSVLAQIPNHQVTGTLSKVAIYLSFQSSASVQGEYLKHKGWKDSPGRKETNIQWW